MSPREWLLLGTVTSSLRTTRITACRCLTQRAALCAIAPNGNIVVADYQNDRVQIFDEEGRFLRIIGKHGDAEGEFDRPFDVAVSVDGNILVTDYENHRVQIFCDDGTFLKAFGSHGGNGGQFDSPGGVAVSAEGLVCVTDCGNGRFQIYSCDNG